MVPKQLQQQRQVRREYGQMQVRGALDQEGAPSSSRGAHHLRGDVSRRDTAGPADAEPHAEPDAEPHAEPDAEPHAEPNPVAHACVRDRTVP